MKTLFEIPAHVASCPHCYGRLWLEVDEWEEDGTPTEEGCHVSCEEEDESRDDGHWDMPYVTLMPLEHKVYLWAKDNVCVVETEEEMRQKLADWNAGKPLPGGMYQ